LSVKQQQAIPCSYVNRNRLIKNQKITAKPKIEVSSPMFIGT